LGLARRDRELPAPARRGARVRGDRLPRRGGPREAAGVRRAEGRGECPRRARARARRVRARTARALQGPARDRLHRRAAEERPGQSREAEASGAHGRMSAPIPHLAGMTWPEAAESIDERSVALLPIGAIEAHGPHLPLDTDVLLSLELCERISSALRPGVAAVVLPPIPFTVARCAEGFAGTISIEPDTVRRLLGDVLRSLARSGLRFAALVNSHLEPEHVRLLEALAAETATGSRLRVLFADHCKKPWA